MICKNCIHKKVCKDYSIYKDTIYACEDFKDGTIKNQYDRIRNMSKEKLAEFLIIWSINCLKGEPEMNIKQYLESEVTE